MKKIIFTVLLISITLSVKGGNLINEKRINSIIEKLTLEQKARLLVGFSGVEDGVSHKVAGAAGWTFPVNELGIPSINLADGPVGIRINPVPSQNVKVIYDENGLPVQQVVGNGLLSGDKRTFCTCFPSTTALAATWDVKAANLQGTLMGDEARGYGVDVILTPGINIMRNPLCGRNFEYYSEDPLLTGKMAASIINGIQSKGIGTSLKHFVANNQQTGKKYNDARISQRALREIYLKGFEICVKESHPWTVMGSYNKIAGEFTQTNKELLIELLRKEWGFDGMVLTDWTVRRPTADLLNARCALMMPGEEEIVQEIIEVVKSGKVSEKTLNACVKDVLGVVAKSITAKGWLASNPDLEKHAQISRKIATEGMVLLKNENSVLPLTAGNKIALFGASAYKSIAGGTGSSNVNKPYVVDISKGLENAGFIINKRLENIYQKYTAYQSEILDKFPNCPDWQKISYHRTVVPEMSLSNSRWLVEQVMQESDIAVIVLGRGSGETSDRQLKDDFNLTKEEREMISLVTEVAHKNNKKAIVVMNVCGTIEVASWNNKPEGILLAWFPGQECGNAVADVISGKSNPSGRLPMTFPISYYDMPSSKNYPYIGQTSGKNFDYTNYEEDIWVGYRYFGKTGRHTAYPFGFGLSYTDFEYSDPKIIKKRDKWTVSVNIKNIGKVAGKEVVQLYVSSPSGKLIKPESELKAFNKTRILNPGESEKVELTFGAYDLASFDENNSQWITEKGKYKVRLGSSSESVIKEIDFNVAKTRTWKTGNILAPVEPVNVIKLEKGVYDDVAYHKAEDFKILGRVYPDSLPIFSRVPDFRKSVTRDALWKLGQHSSGISVRFRSNSSKISLKWESKFRNTMTHMADMGTRGLDLYVLLDDGTWRFLGCGRPMSEPTEWLVVDNMQPKMREYMLHLPLYDGIKNLEIGVKEGSVIENPVVNSPRTEKPLVIYGSSIAHGATASRPGMAASNQLQRKLDRMTINLGFSANAHIDYEIAEMMASVDACAYVLDYVPNATVNEIKTKTSKFVEILRNAHPEVPLIFVEDPIFSHAICDEVTAKTISDKNNAIRQEFERMKAEGMKNIYYVESQEIVPVDGDGSSDGIHFTDLGFRTYTEALSKVLNKVIK